MTVTVARRPHRDPSSGPARRANLAAIGWILLGIFALAGCAGLKDFVMPPEHRGTGATRQRPASRYADLVFFVGRIHGATAADQALAVRGERVLAIGPRAAIEPLVGPNTVVVREPGGYLLPGFVDAHVHLDGAALLADAVDLRGAGSVAELRQRLQAGWSASDDWQWGFGLGGELASQLTSADLDQMVGDTPVYLSTGDGHGALVSGALLPRLPAELAQSLAAGQGRAHGALAMAAWRHLPPVRLERLKPLLVSVLGQLQRKGVTEVHSMGASEALQVALIALEREGRLPLRCVLYFDGERPEGKALLAPAPAPHGTAGPASGAQRRQELLLARRWQAKLVRVAGVKFWLDGTLGARTAALQAPYTDQPGRACGHGQDSAGPGFCGDLRYDDATVAGWIRAADAAGVQVALHAIGDAAVQQIARVLGGLARPPEAQPVRIEHAQVVAPETLGELASQRVVFSVQPLHAVDDAGFALQRLGPARMAWAYQVAALAGAAPVLLGSDLPISAAEPLAAWRHVVAGASPEDAALLCGGPCTEGALGEAALRGLLPGGIGAQEPPLAPGALADFVVWPRSPLTAAGPTPEPVAVLVGGAPILLQRTNRDLP